MNVDSSGSESDTSEDSFSSERNKTESQIVNHKISILKNKHELLHFFLNKIFRDFIKTRVYKRIEDDSKDKHNYILKHNLTRKQYLKDCKSQLDLIYYSFISMKIDEHDKYRIQILHSPLSFTDKYLTIEKTKKGRLVLEYGFDHVFNCLTECLIQHRKYFEHQLYDIILSQSPVIFKPLYFYEIYQNTFDQMWCIFYKILKKIEKLSRPFGVLRDNTGRNFKRQKPYSFCNECSLKRANTRLIETMIDAQKKL